MARHKMYLRHGLKVYDEARSAHLERLSDGGEARLIYRKASYDFDAALAQTVGAKRRSRLGAARKIFTSDASMVELNEPMFLRALPLIAVCIVAGRMRWIRGGTRPRVVAYAIENIDMAAKVESHAGLAAMPVKALSKWVFQLVLRRFDRLVFGTQSAKEGYERFLGAPAGTLQTAVVPALEPVCQTCILTKKRRAVVFLGAFDGRKGVNELMAAWPDVAATVADATLMIIGNGPLELQVADWAKTRAEVELHVDPPRVDIHRALAAAEVLVLPSQSSVRWREQVGLPIVEGLSHGCKIVTTADTGLVDWLREHRHFIAGSAPLSQAIAAALIDTRTAASVINDLPLVSGRQAAEDLLWSS
jgi:glycosyltransferase involved in cell wall biosynthesis